MAVSDYLIPQLQRQGQDWMQGLQKRQQQEQEFKNMVMKAMIEQRIKQQDPMANILNLSKVVEALQSLGIDPRTVMGGQQGQQMPQGMPQGLQRPMPQMQQGQMPQALPQSMQIPRPPMPQMRPQVQSALQPDVRPSEYKQTPFGGLQPTKFEDIGLQAEKAEAASRVAAKSEVLKLGEKARANFGRAVSMFQQITSQLKGKAEEQGGLGLLPGIKGMLATKTKRPGYGRTAAFLGQQRETAIALNSILTGQNRVIRSVVRMIQETLPDEYDPQDIAASKMAQSIKNAYKLVKSFEKAGLSQDVLRKMNPKELNNIDANSLIGLYTLTPKEEQEVERITQDVLRAPIAPKRQLIPTGQQNIQRQPTQPSFKVIRRTR